MNITELKDEFRGIASELKEYVDTSSGTLEVKNKESYDRVNERLDQIEGLLTAQKSEPKVDDDQKEHVRSFKSALSLFAKNERSQIASQVEVKAGYHVGEVKSDNLVRFNLASAGALLLPAAVSEQIIKNVVENTPVMSLARITRTNRDTYKRRVRTSTPGGRWLAEEATNTKTKPTYGTVNISPQKWAARYGWSIEQEQDTGYDLVRELTEAYREDFMADFGTAFTTGDGVGKPTGFVGNVTNFNSAALALTTNMLIAMQAELKEPYHNNATWLFDRYTRAYIRSLVLSATNGLQYTWEPDFTRRTGTLLLGAPVALSRPGDLAGRVSGDFVAGQVPIAYGDFSQGYEVAMHTDMYMIDDPYTEADSFVRNLNIMSRVGGNVIKEEAIVQMTITAS